MEHLEKETAVGLIKHLILLGYHVLASIPNAPKHWHQSPEFEKKNPYEKHRHDWTNEDVRTSLGLALVGEHDAIGVFSSFHTSSV